MLLSANTVLLSRVLVPLLGLLVWLYYLWGSRLAYKPKSWKKSASQLFFIFAAAGIFALQVNLMDHWSPKDAYGNYFFGFVMIECGGALVIGFRTLLRERAKSRRAALFAKDEDR